MWRSSRTACMLAMSFTILCIFDSPCTPVRVCSQGNEDIACQVSISPIAEAATQWRNDAQVTFHDQFWLCSTPVTLILSWSQPDCLCHSHSSQVECIKDCTSCTWCGCSKSEEQF